MPILTGFGLKNFRVFKDETFFELAPITVLTGTNSSGKSSVLKAILLLGDNLKKSDWEELDFTGANHRLGTFQKAKNNTSPEEKVSFYFVLDNTRGQQGFGGWEQGRIPFDGKLVFELSYTEFNAERGRFETFVLKDEAGDVKAQVDYSIGGNKDHVLTYVNFFWFYSQMLNFFQSEDIVENIESLPDREEADEEEGIFPKDFGAKMIWSFHGVKGPKNKEEWEEFKSISNGLVKKELIDELLGEGETTESVVKELNQLMANALHYFVFPKGRIYFPEDLLEGKSARFLDYFRAFSDFVSREGSEVTFNISHLNDLTIGELQANFGEEYSIPEKIANLTAADVLMPSAKSFFKETVENVLFLFRKVKRIPLRNIEAIRATSERFYLNSEELFGSFLAELRNSPRSDKTLEFVNKWIRAFSLGEELYLDGIEGIATNIGIVKNGEKHTLADLGYGVTQLLPILLKVAFFHTLIEPDEKDFQRAILLVEEPETNLHPNLQSKLADFFVDAMNTFKVQLIIETHSEYLIRKLQYLTAKKEIKPEDTSIYYFYEPGKVPDGEPQVKKLDILEDGRLSGTFGPGFFDEADSLAIDLFTLQNIKSN